jgi:acetaldehyde dehydrogenase (acetylating)
LILRDRDLISIQEARQSVERASEAQKKFAAFSQEQIDAVVEACADAATAAGEQLARVAVEETGYGNVPDKILKNRLASVDVPRAIRGMKTVGILREDREKGIIEIGEPVGVVAAVIPSTNPTSTTIYKTLISLKARNAVVLSPHPTAMRCICDTVTVLGRAALKMGAPEGLIECLQHPTMPGTQELMKSRLVGVILATGGTGLVRAAYSSGRPAYGVGPGNVPSLIERTANIKKAVADIFAGKTFDYGTICSSEQSIVAEEAVREKALEECRLQGGYFLSEEEIHRLGEMVFRGGSATANTRIVGRAATTIAEMAGINVPPATRVLIARLDGVGRDFPLSAEKLSPILSFYSAANLGACVDLCVRLLQFGGLGHTASIHSQNEAAVKRFGLAVPAFRIVVNSSSVHGSIGYSTNLFPAMTLGCGSPGGNITSDNIGPQHLMNVKRVAWESRAVEHRTIAADQRMAGASFPTSPAKPMKALAAESASTVSAASAVVAAITAPEAETASTAVPNRETIARIVERVFMARGIPRGGALSAETTVTMPATPAIVAPPPEQTKHSPSPASAPDPAPLAAEAAELASPQAAPPARFDVVEFVSENDVRIAMQRNDKIFVGPKTIVTPSARDLGNSHDMFVVTDALPGPSQKLRRTS